jgi:basic membrane lipoprotein Med (substrate-binding protein (PBP1-ABC) superfamily)
MRTDRQAYETIERIARGDFEPGSFVLGVAQGGVEFLPSRENAHPRWPEVEQLVQQVTEDLLRGEIRLRASEN